MTMFPPPLHSHHHIPLFHCIHWFDLSAPKTMSPLPYTTIPLCPLHPLHTVPTASTVSIAYCIHCVLCPLHTASTAPSDLTFLDQRQCSHHHIPLFQCIHCVHWFDLFAPKTMSPPPYTIILLHPLHPLCPLHSLH